MTTAHPDNTSFEWSDRPRDGMRRLTAEQVRHFDSHGYVLVPDAIPADTIAAVRSEIDDWERHAIDFAVPMEGGTMQIASKDQISFTIHLVSRSPAARSLACHPALVDVCHDLIGPDVRLYWDQAVYKKHEPAREFPWHQDNGYAFVEPQQYLTCWVPLVDATVDNGCPWVVPGRHREGTFAHWPTSVGYQCLDSSAGETDGAVAVEAPVGSIVVFSSLTPHRTGPNRTGEVRKAYILQYAPEGACVLEPGSGRKIRQDDVERQFPVLVAGVAVGG
jgi:phytanoyl-CoA hydroxylase